MTAEVKDPETGKIIPPQRCFVELPFPPNLDTSRPLSRASIQRAVRNAVYEEGLEEYGNKTLVVLNYGEFFDIEFEKKHLTILCPPEKDDD